MKGAASLEIVNVNYMIVEVTLTYTMGVRGVLKGRSQVARVEIARECDPAFLEEEHVLLRMFFELGDYRGYLFYS